MISCEVCGAPPLPLRGACAFCRSRLDARLDPSGLLDYLAEKLPQAKVGRAGLLRRGAVNDVSVRAAGEAYRARLHRGGLELKPGLAPAEWVDFLLTDLSRDAVADADVRSAMAHAGWDLRRPIAGGG